MAKPTAVPTMPASAIPSSPEQPARKPGAEALADLLRVLLAPGEEFADTVDCLSFTVKRTSSLEDEQEGVQEVNVGAFDLKTLLGTSCTSCGVSEALQARIHTSLMERMNNA
mgnify:CR=1 FL=1